MILLIILTVLSLILTLITLFIAFVFCKYLNLIYLKITNISYISSIINRDWQYQIGDPSNWNLDVPIDYVPLASTDPGPGAGGFAPFGARGILRGGAETFFGFIGINNVATMSEEAINPERDIPLSIFITSVVIYVIYLGGSIALTMVMPYYRVVG